MIHEASPFYGVGGGREILAEVFGSGCRKVDERIRYP
jgi:hypothetical protein